MEYVNGGELFDFIVNCDRLKNIKENKFINIKELMKRKLAVFFNKFYQGLNICTKLELFIGMNF